MKVTLKRQLEMNEDAWIGGAGVISLTVAPELSFYCLVCVYLFTPILHFQDVKNCRPVYSHVWSLPWLRDEL